MEDLICHCSEKQQKPTFYGGYLWKYLAFSCGLQCVQDNSLSFRPILDSAFLCKAYPFMVLLDVVKFFEIIYKKETVEEGIGGINGDGKNLNNK